MELMGSTTTQRCTADDAAILANVHLLAAQASLNKMFTQGYFSICTVDTIIKMTYAIPDKTCYDILHTLHCVQYNEMDPLLLRGLPQLIGAAVRMDGLSFERLRI